MRRSPRSVVPAVLLALTACHEAPPQLTAPAPGARVGGDALSPVVAAEGEYTVVFDGNPVGHGPIPLAPVSDGPHRLAVRDAEGRTLDEREIFIDRTPPTVRVLRPAPVGPFGTAPGEATAVVVEGRDAGPMTEVTATGVALAPGELGRSSGTLPLPAQGPLEVVVQAVDAAGNRAEARVSSTPGVLRWQSPMPVEPGDWSAHLLSDDSVLLALGEAAVAIGPDGRERYSLETPGRVLVEAAALPDASVLLRLLNPATPAAAEVQWLDPDGHARIWNRPEAVPLALSHLAGVPFVAWRNGEVAEAGRAPAPWPPATYAGVPLPFEPRRLVTWGDAVVAVGPANVALLTAKGHEPRTFPLTGEAEVVVSGGTLYIADTTGLRIIDTPDQVEPRQVVTVPVNHTCPVPPNGLAYTDPTHAEYRREADLPPRAASNLPPGAAWSADHCVAIGGNLVVSLAGDLAPLVAPGPVRTAQRVGDRVLALLTTEPPRAVVLTPGQSAYEVPLTSLANIIRAVPLPDGLLVSGLAAARPDKALLVRLALPLPPPPVAQKTPPVP